MSISLKNNLQLYLIPTVIFFAVMLILKFNGLYGQDSHEYLRYGRSLSLYFSEGKTLNNFFWSVYYPLSGAILSFITSNNILSLQLISFASFLFSIFYIQRILRLIYIESQENISLYILIAFAVSPIMLIYSQVIMSDMLCLFFITAGFYHSLKFERELRQKDFLFAALFMTAAVLTRYASAVVLLIPAVIMLKTFLRNFNVSTLFISMLIIIVLIIPEFVFKSGNKFEMLNNVWLTKWNAANLFGANFSTLEGNFNYRFINIIYAFFNLFHPAFIFTGIILIPFIRKRDFEINGVMQSLLIIILYGIFIAGIPFQNLRFLLLTFPFVIILMYKPFISLKSYLKNPSIKKLFILSVVIIQLLFYGYMFNNIYKQNKLEREISNYLKDFPGKVIYTFSIDPALRSYKVKNRIINLWKDKISDYKTPAFILFNEQKFATQWAEKNPMINWKYIMEYYPAKKIKLFEDGWELYEIE